MTDDPTGEQHALTTGPWRAVVTQVGGGLRSLSRDGRDLVVSWPAGEPRRLYRGAVLAPWPNRVRDGTYTWAGEEQQLALSEPERLSAMHGLVAWLPFAVQGRTLSSVVLGARLWPQQGYPHTLDLKISYELVTGDSADSAEQADGAEPGCLVWSVTATNAGSAPAPWGTSMHPYLVAGAGRVDDWTVELDAASVLDVDPERLLPERAGPEGALPDGAGPTTSPVDGTDLDLRGGRSLDGLELDHAYTDLGSSTAKVRAADGSGAWVGWDDASRWVQVHTADRPDPAENRVGLAVEPMTCPPDALGTGTDLVHLAPGGSHTTAWRLGALGPTRS